MSVRSRVSPVSRQFRRGARAPAERPGRWGLTRGRVPRPRSAPRVAPRATATSSAHPHRSSCPSSAPPRGTTVQGQSHVAGRRGGSRAVVAVTREPDNHNDNLAKRQKPYKQYAYFQVHRCYRVACTVLSTAGRGCAEAVPPTSQPSLCRCRLTSRSLCRAAALCCSSLLLRTAPLLSGRLLFLSLCVPLAVTTYLCPQTANACGGRRNGRKG